MLQVAEDRREGDFSSGSAPEKVADLDDDLF